MREAAKEGAAGALRPDSLALALVADNAKSRWGKGIELAGGRGREGEFNSNFGQRAPSDGGIRTRGGEKGFLLLKRHHCTATATASRRRPRVDTHKKQLICIEVEAEEKGRRME